ncbi:uncharacterized protein ACA1_079460 [Acanthamoeba castellanii str. Neff]|uniref:Uncharacterized protein n=1 Tax=Acanthamoeba castellanii (strain ATCC 30010 / Neff) TaxID=1257118 RepID=L8GUR1_ACACF|nr:uncharacterized protein ACA1_079460 [Acanthamoeba castellanii str. Neff]ELR15836.1 hypothetical protein ACA1_079460 [Acanthamoeba castellanii str. Neff]
MSDHEESSSSTGKQQFSPISHPPSLSPDRTHVPQPRRVDLGDVGAPNADRIEAWVVDEVLTADECSHYIDQAERVGLASLETVFPQAYRSSDRLLTLAPPHIVRGLFARLLPALDRRGTPRPTTF